MYLVYKFLVGAYRNLTPVVKLVANKLVLVFAETCRKFANCKSHGVQSASLLSVAYLSLR